MSSVDKDALGDRMKMYEGAEAQRRFMPLLPVIARLDGRSFSNFTRGMDRPYDERFSRAMVATTKYLVSHTNACIGYTQSDEISLAWHQTDPESEMWFGGRIQKIVSQLAAQATMYFNKLIFTDMPDFSHRNPTFDARVWQVPNRIEGANAILWREWDATKNAISMASSHYYSPKELHGKNGSERQENFNDYPAFFRRGTYIRRKIVNTPFTAEEIAVLPPKHRARTDPNLVVERAVISVLDLPPLNKIANRTGLIFDGEDPIIDKAG